MIKLLMLKVTLILVRFLSLYKNMKIYKVITFTYKTHQLQQILMQYL